MKGRDGYAVFFFPQALEVLGDAIKPYLQDNPTVGPHVSCDEIDTAGALIEMTLKGRMPTGEDVSLELMVPTSMVRMIVSRESGGAFGFGPRSYDPPAPVLALPGDGQAPAAPAAAGTPGGPPPASAPQAPGDATPG